MKKIVCMFIALLTGLTVLFAFTGCSDVEETTTNKDTIEPSARTDVEKYYIFRLDASAHQAYVFDLSDGSITVACPDPLCPHTPDREKCPFSNGIAVLEAASNGYIYYLKSDMRDFTSTGIYVYDLAANKTKLAVTLQTSIDNVGEFRSEDGKLLYALPSLKKVDGTTIAERDRKVMIYDPVTDKTTELGTLRENDTIRYISGGDVVFESEDGELYRTNGSFDNPEKVRTPGGIPYPECGYRTDLTPGIMTKYTPPASVYFYEKDEIVQLPQMPGGGGIYSPKLNGDKLYYSVSSYAFEPDDEGNYVIDVYITDVVTKETLRYTIESPYNFRIAAGYEHNIIAWIDNKCVDGKIEDISTIGEDQFWLDLDTGRLVVYNNCVSNVRDIIVGEREVKVTKHPEQQ